MTNTNRSLIHELSQKIEQVVQEHLKTSRQEATEALERAFGAEHTITKPRSAPRKAQAGKRRGKDEVAALGDRFYEEVSEKPGESMKVLAAGLGASPHELHRPVALLRQSGRIRTVGQRQHMRYFPMAGEAQASE